MQSQAKSATGRGLLTLASAIAAGTAACSGSATHPAVDGTGGASIELTGGTSAQAAVTGGTLGSGGSKTSSVASTGQASGGATSSNSQRSSGGHANGGASSSVGGSATGGSSAWPAGGRAATGGTATGGRVTGGNANLGGTAPSATGGRATGGVMTGGSTAAGSASSPILEPASGALLGLYYGDASISATVTKLARTVPLHLTYYAFSDDWTTDATTEDLRAGRIPFVNWELFGATLDDIAGGTYDTLLKQRAAAAKKLEQKFFIDFGAEMNGDWSPWSGAENGNSATKYLAAYRHVHDIFVAAGATNAIWAFCPNVTSVPDTSWNEPLDYYPGDDYVDWMCVDGYNWGTSEAGGAWQSFYQVFKDIYPVLATKNKPIIIGEMASTELGGNKAAWITDIVPSLKNQFPLVKGLIWFDINKETDWRISSSAASEAAFKSMANDPWFVR